ncbi:chemotaxis protein CheA [Mangrovitalea sediminis]|uniref:chemotaxis protein CheA n=1 Tax=Mangrovitalea sediminis TaxID=1982043 RepID=UPI000BE4EABC|nr:chemotaxis protein CheA [Mangrovitalea sediminis]
MLDDEQWRWLAETFISEAQELLQRAEMSLSDLEQDLQDVEAINSLFRAVHTLKGSAGILGVDFVVGFTHHYENLLVGVRDGDIPLDSALLHLCYRCLDRINHLIEAATGGLQDDPDPEATAILVRQLNEVQRSGADLPVAQDGQHQERGTFERVSPASDQRDQAWHISLRFDRELFRSGFDPASFLRYLGRLGQLTEVIYIADELPDDLADFDPEQCYFGLEINLLGDTTKADIEQVFEFLDDLATIRILPPESQLEDYIQLIRALPEDDHRLGEILVKAGLLTEKELQQGLNLQSAEQGRKLGEVVVDAQMVAPEAVQVALEKQSSVRERLGRAAYLKIASDKMDELINQVGELVIAAEGMRLAAQQSVQARISERAEELCRHVESIRESALRLRMVEIGETFNRFHRLIRETGDGLGKQVKLDIQGADTELDKTMVDRIYEPLVHLVRNAIDHGLESPERRLEVGKPEQGTVTLNAFHESGQIVIEVSDDGGGIDPDRILQKAIERDLVAPGADIDEQSVLQLIFHPGFSTAQTVTNISGRGVGMDSVRKDIDGLRGTIEIDNRPGRGCCFRIRLPLTLAIIEGFLVSVGEQYYVIPLELVTECIELPAHLAQKAEGYLELRGQALPYLALRHYFSIKGGAAERQSLVVVRQGNLSAGVLVDRLHGEIQTVIKPLGQLFQHLKGVGGATILGSGEVALILDIGSLLRQVCDQTDAGSDRLIAAMP